MLYTLLLWVMEVGGIRKRGVQIGNTGRRGICVLDVGIHSKCMIVMRVTRGDQVVQKGVRCMELHSLLSCKECGSILESGGMLFLGLVVLGTVLNIWHHLTSV